MVGGRVEYLPAIIATSDHVIQTTGDFDASLPSHGRRMLLRTNLAVNTLRHACCWQRVYSAMDKLCIESIVNFGKFSGARIAQIASLTPVCRFVWLDSPRFLTLAPWSDTSEDQLPHLKATILCWSISSVGDLSNNSTKRFTHKSDSDWRDDFSDSVACDPPISARHKAEASLILRFTLFLRA